MWMTCWLFYVRGFPRIQFPCSLRTCTVRVISNDYSTGLNEKTISSRLLDTRSDVTTKKGKNYSPPMRGGDECYFRGLHPPQVTLYTGCLDSSGIFKDTRCAAYSSLPASMAAKDGGSVYLDCVRYESCHHVRFGGTAPKMNRGPDALLLPEGSSLVKMSTI
jgi:hypothetical protein